VALLAGAAPAAHASALDDGNAAFDAGQYQAALRSWTAAASEGDPQAAFDLGLLYDLGDGVSPSAATAFHWYWRAAEAGLGAAAFNVGVMYDSGRGVALDRVKAALWYARAAALGETRAAFNLGQLYETGEGVPQNVEAAIAWYGVAAAAIPEAAVKATALAAHHPAAAGPFVPPVPAWPIGGAAVPVLGSHPAVQLVWTAPAEPAPVTYFVEMQARENGHFDEVTSGYVPTTALSVPLPNGDAFAWRVYAVASDGSGYASSAWMRFGKAGGLQALALHVPSRSPGSPPRAALP
jgi:hypothetical protein